jgi:hypothetical protein
VLQGTGMPAAAAAAGGGVRGAAAGAAPGRGAGMMTVEQLAALDKADRRAAKKAEKKVRHDPLLGAVAGKGQTSTACMHACMPCCGMSVQQQKGHMAPGRGRPAASALRVGIASSLFQTTPEQEILCHSCSLSTPVAAVPSCQAL